MLLNAVHSCPIKNVGVIALLIDIIEGIRDSIFDLIRYFCFVDESYGFTGYWSAVITNNHYSYHKS